MYIALDKGPISSYHILIIPIEHYGSSLLLAQESQEEIQRIKQKLN